jgi:hypothetical protein
MRTITSTITGIRNDVFGLCKSSICQDLVAWLGTQSLRVVHLARHLLARNYGGRLMASPAAVSVSGKPSAVARRDRVRAQESLRVLQSRLGRRLTRQGEKPSVGED